MSKARRFLILLVLTLLCLALSGAWGEEYQTLRLGDSGPAVLQLKTRMYYLGYFTSLNLSDQYNKVMVERVQKLQKANGLEETGVATPELQALIYSDDCVWQSPTPKPSPVPTPAPTPVAPIDSLSLPDREDNGFLPQGSAPFSYANRDAGHWLYISDDIQAEIKRYEDPAIPLIWFETHIQVQGGVRLRSMLSSGKTLGHTFTLPTRIAEEHKAVVAFSDDFFGYRWKYDNNKIQGIIIRDGVVYCEKTRSANRKTWPPLDIMAVFPDGSMKTFTSDDHTAQEYLAMGVIDTYAFGPILVQAGALHEDIWNWRSDTWEPRTAFGMVEPGHYCALTVLGRRKDSKGITIQDMAKLLLDMGVQEGLMLDGGNTNCLIFQGEIINRPVNVKTGDIRQVTGLIGVSEGE